MTNKNGNRVIEQLNETIISMTRAKPEGEEL